MENKGSHLFNRQLIKMKFQGISGYNLNVYTVFSGVQKDKAAHFYLHTICTIVIDSNTNLHIIH